MRRASPAAQGGAILALVAIAAASLLVVLWTMRQGPESVALMRMPEVERRALYGRTLRTLESTCEPRKRPDGLADHCRRQAELIVQFPECDATCEALAEAQRARPSR